MPVRDITDDFNWNDHRFARYLTLRQMLQRSLRGSRRGFDDFGGALTAGGLPAETGYSEGHGGAWCREAAVATEQLLERAGAWGSSEPPTRGFDQGNRAEPAPAPAIRIVPDV